MMGHPCLTALWVGRGPTGHLVHPFSHSMLEPHSNLLKCQGAQDIQK